MKNYFLPLLTIFIFMESQAQQHLNLIVGTYTNTCDSKGIYVYDFNTETAAFKLKANTERVVNPSYITVSDDNKFLYSVNENGLESTVSSFKFDAKTGKTEFVNEQLAQGADPCYILNDSKNVIVANYSGGTIAVFNKDSEGGLREAKQVIQHKGKSSNAKRQEKAHVHMVLFTPDRKFVVANDLGTDHIYIYKYDPDAKEQVLQIKDSVAVKPGSGPRHITFSKDGKFAYLIQELDGKISIYTYDNGKLTFLNETSVVEPGFTGDISAAAIKISPDQRFVYATNRGTANTISYYKRRRDGVLLYKGQTSTLGKGPRDFTIDPTGKFLLVAHQNTNEVVIFSIDKASGKLTDTGKRIALCSPVNLVFTP